jgi:hypothetical protein
MVPGKYAVQHKNPQYFSRLRSNDNKWTQCEPASAIFLREIIYYVINNEEISALEILTPVHNINLISLRHEND